MPPAAGFVARADPALYPALGELLVVEQPGCRSRSIVSAARSPAASAYEEAAREARASLRCRYDSRRRADSRQRLRASCSSSSASSESLSSSPTRSPRWRHISRPMGISRPSRQRLTCFLAWPPFERRDSHLRLLLAPAILRPSRAIASVARISTEMPRGPIQPRSAPPACAPWSAITRGSSVIRALSLDLHSECGAGVEQSLTTDDHFDLP